jgi:hypothetical protein
MNETELYIENLKNWIEQQKKLIAENHIMDKHADELMNITIEFKRLRARQNEIIAIQIEEAITTLLEWEAKL